MGGRHSSVIGWEPIQNVPLVLTPGDFMHTIRRPRGSADYPASTTARIVFTPKGLAAVELPATATDRELVWRAESSLVTAAKIPGRTPYRLYLTVTNEDATVDDWLWITGVVRRID